MTSQKFLTECSYLQADSSVGDRCLQKHQSNLIYGNFVVKHISNVNLGLI
ncbi:hypothetical protein HCU40_04640 [Pseudanabaena biceps]|nr:hypothetical protein [Pseudanabaena biceps]